MALHINRNGLQKTVDLRLDADHPEYPEITSGIGIETLLGEEYVSTRLADGRVMFSSHPKFDDPETPGGHVLLTTEESYLVLTASEAIKKLASRADKKAHNA